MEEVKTRGKRDYPKSKKILGINPSSMLGTNSDGLVGFTDADWGSQHHRHSISGAAFLFNGGAVGWTSRKQTIVALSSTEAEYVAAAEAARELIWLRSLLSELTGQLTEPTTLYGDNQSQVIHVSDWDSRKEDLTAKAVFFVELK